VPAGTTVRWINGDAESHTVTEDLGRFDAEIWPGESFSFTFSEPGVYFYYCKPHDWMIGEITVVEPGQATRTESPASG
jgi:plastocyanin